tara:strand:- start:152 stop:649 length:498 start_codon:yes stop_codon:yes gene_type:complete
MARHLKRHTFAAALIASLPCWAAPVVADDLVGRASVIDGDTIEIHGQRIRLHGIDAPESRQLCRKDGQEYRCGQQASLALADKIGVRPVTCEPRDIDRYQRIVAVCRDGEEDLNAWMVLQGHAVAYRRYSKDYIATEEQAQAERRGIWSGEFTMPWLWRRGERLK